MGVKVPLRLIDVERYVVRFFAVFLLFSILIVSVGCDDNNNNIGDSGEPSQADIDTTPPSFVLDPVITMGPNPNTPLSGLLELQTDEPTRVSVSIAETAPVNSALTRGFSEPSTIDFEEFSTVHSLPLLGFTPDDTFTIEVTVTDKSLNKRVFDAQLFVTTDALPEDFPPIQVESSPELMEPGVTLFDVAPSGANGSFGRAIVAVNPEGEVIWYHKPEGGVSDLRMLPNGNLLFMNDPQVRTEILEIDMLGNVINRWHASQSTSGSPGSIPVDTLSFHHEVVVLDNGNLLAMGIELVEFEDYPTSDSDPEAPLETAVVAGDTVIEFSPEGTIVSEWSYLEMLDPYRIGYLSLGGFWNNQFPEITGGTRDWSHGNAVIHDPLDNSVIASLRHLDAVVKFSRDTGELIWIMGPHENWDPVIFGPFLLNPIGENFLWQYHQHAPEITPDGNILLFDNGNFRASPFDDRLPAEENFSRAVEFSVNEVNMQITQVWEYGEFTEETLYAPFLGDADYMDSTGNVLITFGGITKDAEGNQTDVVGTSKRSARIIEVTRSSPAVKVFDLSIIDTSPEVLNGWSVYRSERIPSLYPGN